MDNIQELQNFLTANHMSEVLRSLNIIPWIFDFQTNVITSNLAYIDARYASGIIIHKQSFEDFIEAILPEHREEMLDAYRRVKNGITTRFSLQLKIKLGERRTPTWVEVNMVAHEKDEQGVIVTAVGCTTIIQTYKEAELVMLNAQKKAEQANLIKTNFLANMTHEFRTPLNAILGFTTIMAHSETLEERMQCLGAVQASGSLLIQIIDGVIELSKLEANEVELHRNLVDINNLIDKTVEQAKPRRKPDVEMTFHHTEANIILHGDEEKIASVLTQILNNACKYTDHGTIDVYCHKSSEHAVITVKDTGVGMSQETVTHIFERFYKGNSFIPGAGLGMSIVKGLVDLWNGTIKVDSTPDVGTSVTFTIPLHTTFFQNRI